MIDRIRRLEFAAQDLVDRFPQRPRRGNKAVVHEIACPPGAAHAGTLTYSRWRSSVLPEAIPKTARRPAVEIRPGFFGYEPVPNAERRRDWYLNFAAADLFCTHDTGLLAQDEMQVAEHPALASLRAALLAGGESTLTVEEDVPTPILIAGVERRCAIATEPDEKAGRPRGLYGNAFAAASPEAVRRATRALSPPTVSSLVAMEAPPYGRGRYSSEDIAYVFETAFVGFLATRLESYGESEARPDVVVHTGFWGCGAYGGNRTLMSLVQLLAAQFAELDRFVFHTGNQDGARVFRAALETYSRVAPVGRDTALVGALQSIEAMGFEWGVGDGN